MDSYLALRLVHILAAVVVAGTGVGIAFFMFMANRSNNRQAIYITTGIVIIGDWLFTAPAIVVQLVTGILLMNHLGYSFNSPWFYCVAGLYVLIGACWIPVIIIQYKLRDIAAAALDGNHVAPEFKRWMTLWTALGIPAFAAILVLFWLMVAKPLPVT